MTHLADDQTIAQRVLDHITKRTTDTGAASWREPVHNYLDAERFDRELHLLRRLPTAFCPSVAVPAAGSWLARDAAGIPIVAVRGADGTVRAFRNVCRHRGMQVVAGSGCQTAFVCGYHGWTYGLDGTLRHVPHREGFPDLDESTRGLVAVSTVERHGLVFVAQEGAAAPGNELSELDGLITGDLELVATSEQDEPTNWKIMVETFLEGYHIRSTHRTSFYPVQYDNLNVVESFGRNSRITFPYRNIERLTDVAPAERTVDGKLTYLYHLFANVVIATFPDRTLVIALEPLTPSRTTVVTYALGRERRSDEVAQQRGEQESYLLSVGAAEDFAAARAIQRGLASGANEHLEFGLYESAIGHFHHHLDTALADTIARGADDR